MLLRIACFERSYVSVLPALLLVRGVERGLAAHVANLAVDVGARGAEAALAVVTERAKLALRLGSAQLGHLLAVDDVRPG